LDGPKEGDIFCQCIKKAAIIQFFIYFTQVGQPDELRGGKLRLRIDDMRSSF